LNFEYHIRKLDIQLSGPMFMPFTTDIDLS